ncbi:MAG: tail fiber domain-containing protein [Candidatus Zixiibacteriota bacterium]
MVRKSFVLMVMGTVILLLCSISFADVPHMVNYQGKLTDSGGGLVNDTVQMTFSIYPDTLGSPADWSETQTQVIVENGIFNVLLGAVDTIPSAVFDGNVKYLGVQVESDLEMTPLKPMVSVAYAFHSATADSALNAPVAGLLSVDGVSNPGGDVDLIQSDAIAIIPNDGANTITIGETHSARTDNPHMTTAAQVGAPVSVDGVQNDGGNIDLIPQNAITITPNDGANTIAFGENHSTRTDNPHMVTATQTGTPVSVDGVSNAGGDIDFIAGSNMTITPDDGANTVTFSATGGGIGGSGTANYIPRFTAPTTIGNSVVYQSGSSIGIGTTGPPTRLAVIGLPPNSGYPPLMYNPGNGAIYFQASSERYKRDVQSLDDDFSAILHAEPKSFVNATSGKQEIGFIAEEFDALGLSNLVFYLEGQPNGIKYDMISLYLLEVVKELRAENEDLQSRIEALEAK